MGSDEREIEASRRDLAALLGVLGGAVGLAALTGCAEGGGSSREDTATVVEAVSGSTLSWFDTIAKPTGSLMTTAGPANAYKAAIVFGYGNAGDGGGGVFYWDFTDSSTAPDGGTVFAVNGADGGPVKGRWKRIYSGAVDVKWFGAVGDGTTPDDAAIQLAINAAAFEVAINIGGGAGVVYFPPGTYVLNNPLTITATGATNQQSNVVLRGASAEPGGQYIRSRLMWNGASNTAMLFLWSRENIVEYLAFGVNPGKTALCAVDCTQVSGGPAITRNTFRCVRISNEGGTGTFVYGVKLADRMGWNTGNPGAYPQSCDYMTFEDCVFDRIQTAGVYCPNTTGQSKAHLFKRCIFNFIPYGVQYQSGSISFESSSFGAISTCAIYMYAPADYMTMFDTNTESCAMFLNIVGSNGNPYCTSIIGGRLSCDTVAPYTPPNGTFISIGNSGPLVFLGCEFEVNARPGDPLTVPNWNILGNAGLAPSHASCKILMIGCSYPPTINNPFLQNTQGNPARFYALGCQSFDPTHGSAGTAPIDDSITTLNGGPERLALGTILALPQTLSAPSKPASGFLFYVDPADGKLKTIGSNGTVTVIGSP